MAALSAASLRMESGIWFLTNRFGRGLGGGGCCCTNWLAAVVSAIVGGRRVVAV